MCFSFKTKKLPPNQIATKDVVETSFRLLGGTLFVCQRVTEGPNALSHCRNVKHHPEPAATLYQHLRRCCKSYLSVCLPTASSWAGRANLHVLLLAGSRRLFSLLFIGDPADLWLVEKTSLEPSCNTQPDGIKYPPLALICPQIEIDGRGPTGYLSPHPLPPPLSPWGAF